jgi:hypothetical protein
MVRKILIIGAVIGSAILPAAAFASSVSVTPGTGSDAAVIITPTDSADTVSLVVTGLGNAFCDPAPLGSPIDMNDLVNLCYGQGLADFGAGQSAYTIFVCNASFPGQDVNCSSVLDPAYATGNFQWTAPVPPPPSVGAITMPTGFTPALTANVSAELSDIGMLQLIGVVAGVPLAFYVMKELIALMDQRRAHRASLEKIRDLNDRVYH